MPMERMPGSFQSTLLTKKTLKCDCGLTSVSFLSFLRQNVNKGINGRRQRKKLDSRNLSKTDVNKAITAASFK
jgi:hypothetical protein